MIDKLNAVLDFNQQAVNLRGHRQQLLASNIANADTPNYKARDIDFKSALQGALTGTSGALNTTSSRHLAPSAGSAASVAPLLYRAPLQGSVDGNTVDMDVERSQFADNAIHYEAGLASLTHEIKLMLAALQG
jgi:flagellar basal-body rod protein FlgB